MDSDISAKSDYICLNLFDFLQYHIGSNAHKGIPTTKHVKNDIINL